MKKVLWGLWIFFLLMVTAKVAGQVYAIVGGGWRGDIASLGVLAGAVMLYLVGAIIVSTLWAFIMVGGEKVADHWRRIRS